MYYTRTFLEKELNRARRKRVLYSALEVWEHRYLWGMTKTFDEIRSIAAVKIIMKILKKLKEALKCAFVKAMETEGYQKAEKLAAQAVEWGYRNARRWALDSGFSRYLTFLEFTKPKGWVV